MFDLRSRIGYPAVLRHPYSLSAMPADTTSINQDRFGRRPLKLMAVLAAVSMATALTGLARPAAAQQNTYLAPEFVPGETVMDRFDRLHRPEGFTFGPFTINPSLDIGLGYDTNIYDTHKNTKSDGFLTTTLGATATASGGDYYVGLNGSASRATYFTLSTNDAWYGALSANGWKDVGNNLRVSGNAYVGREIEARDDPQSTGETEPVEFWHYKTGIGLETLNALVTTNVGLAYDRREYGTIPSTFGSVDLTERNMNEIDGSTRFTYHITDNRSVYLNLLGNARLPDHKYDNSGIQRQSSGIAATFGTDYAISEVLRFTGQAGYQGQYYVDSQVKNASGPLAKLSLSWLPTEFTQVLVSFEHSFYESFDSDNDITSPGFWQNSGSIGVTQELTRDLVFIATATIADRDFINKGRNETVYALDANLKWNVTTGLILSLENTFEIQEARRDDGKFTSNLTLLHLTKTF